MLTEEYIYMYDRRPITIATSSGTSSTSISQVSRLTLMMTRIEQLFLALARR